MLLLFSLLLLLLHLQVLKSAVDHQLDPVELVDLRRSRIVIHRDYICLRIRIPDAADHPFAHNVIWQAGKRLDADDVRRALLDQVEHFRSLENKKLPADLDYSQISGIRLEARAKLNERKPENIGQAARISGVSPSDISVLLVYFEKEKRHG